MSKTILITGATDGIGLEAAKLLAAQGHRILLSGRSRDKLASAVGEMNGAASVECYTADLSKMREVLMLAEDVMRGHSHIDVLINNAGVFQVEGSTKAGPLDVRFMVNTIAPYVLTKRLIARMGPNSRIVNVSSAAQAPVDLDAFRGQRSLDDGAAYAQSKLALTMWTRSLAMRLGSKGPLVVSVNPASMLGTKMVREAFGVDGGDVMVGADIVARAAVSDEFEGRSGAYYDNDARTFAAPHPDGLNPDKIDALMTVMNEVVIRLGG